MICNTLAAMWNHFNVKFMESIYNREDKNFRDHINSYSEEEQEKFVKDGLCLSSIVAANPIVKLSFSGLSVWPEELYLRDKRRITFVGKEANKEEGQDYRNWRWYELGDKTAMKKVLAGLLEGLHITTSGYLPHYTDEDLVQNVYRAFASYPFAFCNIKKLSGDVTADIDEIWKYAKRDQTYLQQQIRNILQSNIIVCFGSTVSKRVQDQKNKMINLVKDIIYPDIKEKFREINAYCQYNVEDDILLIDSYHFSYPEFGGWKAESLVNHLLSAFQEFIRIEKYKN